MTIEAMKLIGSFDTEAEAHFAAGLLEQRSIPHEIRGGSISIETPSRPELWIVRDVDLPAALEALRDPPKPRRSAWRCPGCREENEPAFDACWSCGAERP